MNGAQRVRRGDHVDILATTVDGKRAERVTVTLLQNVIVLERTPQNRLTILVLPQEAELLALSARIAPMTVVRRHPDDTSVNEVGRTVGTTPLLDRHLEATFRKARQDRFQRGLARIAHRATARGPVKGSRELCLPLTGTTGAVAGDSLDVIATLLDPLTKDWISFTLLSDVLISGPPRGHGCVPLLLTSEESERTVQALRLSEGATALRAALRNPGDPDLRGCEGPADRSTILTGEKRGGSPSRDRYDTIKRIRLILGLPGVKPPPARRPRPRARPTRGAAMKPRPRARPSTDP